MKSTIRVAPKRSLRRTLSRAFITTQKNASAINAVILAVTVAMVLVSLLTFWAFDS